jgi:hypothetical protein
MSLARAVANANGGKLRVRTDQEQQLWSECSRLLADCIIFSSPIRIVKKVSFLAPSFDLFLPRNRPGQGGQA